MLEKSKNLQFCSFRHKILDFNPKNNDLLTFFQLTPSYFAQRLAQPGPFKLTALPVPAFYLIKTHFFTVFIKKNARGGKNFRKSALFQIFKRGSIVFESHIVRYRTEDEEFSLFPQKNYVFFSQTPPSGTGWYWAFRFRRNSDSKILIM